MKTLILYATKYGATREIAERIAKRINGAEIYDIKTGNIPAFTGYDNIIIGSSIYAGSIRKEAKEFLTVNAEKLSGKTVGLFISGMSEAQSENAFNANFPSVLIENAKIKAVLGGIFDPGKAGMMAKIIMKIVTKQSGYVNNISDDKIDKFVQNLTSGEPNN